MIPCGPESGPNGGETVRAVPMSETSRNTLRKTLAVAAVVEVGTGLVLMIDPAIVVTVLPGAAVSGAGTLLGRC